MEAPLISAALVTLILTPQQNDNSRGLSQYWFLNVSFCEAVIWLHSKNKKKEKKKKKEEKGVNPVTRN